MLVLVFVVCCVCLMVVLVAVLLVLLVGPLRVSPSACLSFTFPSSAAQYASFPEVLKQAATRSPPLQSMAVIDDDDYDDNDEAMKKDRNDKIKNKK
jgi:hypothetical protein